MKTLDVLTKKEVMDQYKLTPYFLKQHAREMGAVGKPMVFDRELVELFLRRKFWQEEIEREANEARAQDIQEFIDKRVRSIQSAASIKVSGEILGRGGRTNVA